MKLTGKPFLDAVLSELIVVTERFYKCGLCKLLEKYNNLAREALSNGDKILSENYFQYADHFLRVVGNKNFAENNLKNNSENSIINKNSEDQIVSNSESNITSKTPSDNKEEN